LLQLAFGQERSQKKWGKVELGMAVSIEFSSFFFKINFGFDNSNGFI